MYRYIFDHDRNLLDIAWNDQFTPDTIAPYADELLTRFRAEGFGTGYRLRMDMRRSAVQRSDAIPVFDRAFQGFPQASRIAVITASAIQRFQVLRVMRQPYLRVFDDADAALDWLTEGDRVRALRKAAFSCTA